MTQKEKKESKAPTAPKATPIKEPASFPGAFSLFKPSIEILRRNLTAFAILVGIPTALSLIGSGPDLFATSNMTLKPDISSGYAFIGFISVILTIVTLPGVILLELQGAHKKQPDWMETFKAGLPYLLKLIGLAICLFFIYVVSLLLLIVPFFFALRRYALAPYYLVDRKLGVFEALKVCAKESKPNASSIWGMIGVFVLIGLVSVLPILGVLASTIIGVLYSVAPAIRYLQITQSGKGKSVLTPIEKDLQQAESAA